MTTLEIKNKDERAFYISLFKKIQEGWKVIKEPYKTWRGNWICEIKEPEKPKLTKKLKK